MIPLPVIALAAMVAHIDPWAEMKRDFYVMGHDQGLTDDQIRECIRYTILINERAGWKSPERRVR